MLQKSSPRSTFVFKTRLEAGPERRHHCPAMMKSLALFGLLLCLSCGCATRHYKVILRNNQVIAASTRPKVDKATATYHFKDKAGRPMAISAYDVKEIEVR